MDLSTTHRLALPLLHAGQAQKEIFHNEALAAIDFLVQPVVVTIDATIPPPSPVPGECHIIGADAEGDWTGADHSLACWTLGGWRFATPFEGMGVWLVGTGPVRFTRGEWRVDMLVGRGVEIDGQRVIGARADAIPIPIGGSVADIEAREAIAALIDRLEAHGLIAPSVE